MPSEADLVFSDRFIIAVLFSPPNAGLQPIFKDSLTDAHHAQSFRLDFSSKLYTIWLLSLLFDSFSTAEGMLLKQVSLQYGASRSNLGFTTFCLLNKPSLAISFM